MNEATFDRLIAALARGQSEWVEDYLRHFPRAERGAPTIRAGLAQRVAPAIMAEFERLAPWLLDGEDGDTRARVRRALTDAAEAGLSASELAARIRRVPIEEIGAVVGAMRKAGEVTVEKRTTKGRPTLVHRLAEHSAGVHTMDEMRDPFVFVVPESARVYSE